MAQIQTSTSRSGFASQPRARGNNYVSAQDIAAGTPNYGELGDALQGAGGVGMRIATDIDIKQQEANTLNAINDRMTVSGEEMNRLKSLQGAEAANAMKEYEDYSRIQDERILSGLKDSPAGQEMYRRRMMDYDRQNLQILDGHILRESENARVIGLKANIQTEMDNAVANPENGMAVVNAIQRIKNYNSQLYRGVPPEALELQNQQDAMLTAEKVANALAVNPKYGPGAALAFLNSGVEQEIGGGAVKVKFDELRGKLQEEMVSGVQKQIVNAETSRLIAIRQGGGDAATAYAEIVKEYGTEIASKAAAGLKTFEDLIDKTADKDAETARKEAAEEAGQRSAIQVGREAQKAGMSESQLSDLVYADENFTVETARTALNAWRDEDKAQKAATTNQDLQRSKQLDDEFDQAGGIVAKMASFGELTPTEKTAYYKKEAEFDKATAEPSADPDLDTYLTLGSMTNEELNDRWSNKEQRDSDIDAMGGLKSDWSKRHISRIEELANGKRQGGKAEKPPETQTVDTELNNIKRDLELAIADTGRSMSDDERKIFVNRNLNAYSKKLSDYMVANNLEKVTQVPVADRDRMRAETILTYRVNLPGSMFGNWWPNEVGLTEAEAGAVGVSIQDRPIDPGSMPTEYRRNHIEGSSVVRRMDDKGETKTIDVNIPLSSTPQNVQTAASRVGAGAHVTRNLDTGVWLVMGQREGFIMPSDASTSHRLTRKQAEEAQSYTSPYDDDPDYLYPFGRAGN